MSNKDDSQSRETSTVLDEADLALLGESLTPVTPDALIRERILSRVRARISAEAGDASSPGSTAAVKTVRSGDGNWEEINPGAYQRVLHDDGQFRTMLVRLEAGAMLPMHKHTLEEECFVVEGDIWLSGLHMHSGDYQRVRPGTAHADIRSDAGCLLHVRAQSQPAESSMA